MPKHAGNLWGAKITPTTEIEIPPRQSFVGGDVQKEDTKRCGIESRERCKRCSRRTKPVSLLGRFFRGSTYTKDAVGEYEA